MQFEKALSETPLESAEELYSALNHAAYAGKDYRETDLERIESVEAGEMLADLPGEVKASSEGLIYYQGEIELTAIAGDVTAARNEDTDIYWLTDGEETYWIKETGLEQTDNYIVEQLHVLGQQILQSDEESLDELTN